jgi:CBS domain-containing protein
MTDPAVHELARVVADLAQLVGRATGEPGARDIVARARALRGSPQPDDPARLALGEQTVTVEVDVPGRVVVETLANERTGAAVVVSTDGPVGIVAERDIVAALAAGKSLDRLEAGDLNSATFVTADVDATLRDVAALMARHRVRHVPLVEGGRVLGVVSAVDIANALAASG